MPRLDICGEHGQRLRALPVLLLVFGVCLAPMFSFACWNQRDRDTSSNRSGDAVSSSGAAHSRDLLPGEGDEPEGRPNVLVLAVDNLRASRLSSWGGPNPTSSTLDGLTQRGTRFADCTAQAPYSPHSWSSLLSSLPVSSLPVRERARAGTTIRRAGLEPYHVTLAEAMHAAGYVTAAVVQGWFTEAFGLRQGFDEVDFRRRSATEVAAASIDWLQRWAEEGRRRPFLLFSYSLDVHAEFMKGRPDDAHVFGGDPKGFRYSREQMRRISRGAFEASEADLRNALTLYDEGIYWTDRSLRPLLATLEELEIAHNTLIVVVSDHGEAFGEHGLYGHGTSNYVEEIHVPLIVVDPRVSGRGRVVNTPVMNIDVLPTILDLAGVPIPEQAHGMSLAASVRGRRQPELTARGVYSEGARLGFVGAVRVGRLSLVIDGHRKGRLFDLRTDPEQRNDLSAQLPHVVRALETLMLQHKRSGAADQLLFASRLPLALDDMALPQVPPRLTRGGADAVLSESEQKRLRALGYLQ